MHVLCAEYRAESRVKFDDPSRKAEPSVELRAEKPCRGLKIRDMDRGVYRLDTFDPYRVDTDRIEAVLQLSVSYRTLFYDSIQKKIILPTLTI